MLKLKNLIFLIFVISFVNARSDGEYATTVPVVSDSHDADSESVDEESVDEKSVDEDNKSIDSDINSVDDRISNMDDNNLGEPVEDGKLVDDGSEEEGRSPSPEGEGEGDDEPVMDSKFVERFKGITRLFEDLLFRKKQLEEASEGSEESEENESAIKDIKEGDNHSKIRNLLTYDSMKPVVDICAIQRTKLIEFVTKFRLAEYPILKIIFSPCSRIFKWYQSYFPNDQEVAPEIRTPNEIKESLQKKLERRPTLDDLKEKNIYKIKTSQELLAYRKNIFKKKLDSLLTEALEQGAPVDDSEPNKETIKMVLRKSLAKRPSVEEIRDSGILKEEGRDAEEEETKQKIEEHL